ncbi:MAG: cupin domain-containing protein [Lysobacteraceae bacterium]|nr:MAG: cupin domain-containing protein [Xanthomonadaceae bacterium]
MKQEFFRFGRGFRLGPTLGQVQAAQMVLEPGDSEGGSQNRHRGADQWLFVVEGAGLAIVEDRRLRLKPGSLLVIAHGERHEIRNTGTGLLKTLNFYSPPAYRSDQDELPAGRA